MDGRNVTGIIVGAVEIVIDGKKVDGSAVGGAAFGETLGTDVVEMNTTVGCIEGESVKAALWIFGTKSASCRLAEFDFLKNSLSISLSKKLSWFSLVIRRLDAASSRKQNLY